MKRSAAALGIVASACAASSTPEEAMEGYARAVARRDGQAVLEASGSAVRAQHDAGSIQRFLEKNPATVQQAVDALGEEVVAVEERARVLLASGTVVDLHKQDGDWVVVESPLPLPLLDTPEHALRTFFFAARGHLSLLRRTMPDAARRKFASDADLGRHLHRAQGRIQAAEALVGPLEPGRATVEGDYAWIPYGDGREVQLVREDDTWRVLDIE